MNRLLHFILIMLVTSPFVCAQKTIEFRINGIASNIGDMDGWGAGASDPQWNFEIEANNMGGDSDNDSRELSGTNCPGIRSYTNTFFSQSYDCQLPSSWDFIFRGFEDDGIGSEANTGDRTFTFNTSTLNLTSSTTWKNVFGGSGWVEARAGGSTCSASLNTPNRTSGSGSVRYQIRLQYRVLGSSLCKDECTDPYVLPTAAEYECQSTQTTTPLSVEVNAKDPGHATPNSYPTTGITCPIAGASPEDIWVRTTIPDSAGGVEIQFENNGGCSGFACFTNVTYAWYTSSDGTCAGLEYRGCGSVSCFFGCSDGKIKVDGREGEDVWVRIWEEDDQGFDITINQIKPTAPADKCYTAMPLSQIGCNYGATAPTSGTYAEPDNGAWTAAAHPGGNCQDGDNNPATNTVWGSNENLVWYTFTHTTTSDFNIAVDNMNCQGGSSSAQLGVFTNSGTPQNPTCDLSTETGMGCSVGVGAVQLSISNLPAGEYILVIDGNAGAECIWEFKEFIGGPLLPMEFKEFKGEFNKEEDKVYLSWIMPTTDQMEGFDVERSLDGINFDKIAYVPAAQVDGGTALDMFYDFNDLDYPDADVVYYRLEQRELSGKSMLSTTVAVSPVRHDAGVSVLQDIYPNPAQEKLTIPFITAQEDLISAEIYDMRGQMVQMVANKERFSEGRHKITVYMNDLLPGIYTLRFIAGNVVTVKRFVKAN